MNKMKHILPLFIGVMMTCIISCVNVDIIDGTERATTSLLRLSFNWNGEEADKPQYLQLISVRNVMTWRAHAYVDTDDGYNPWFGYSTPLIEEEKPNDTENEVLPDVDENPGNENEELPDTEENEETPVAEGEDTPSTDGNGSTDGNETEGSNIETYNDYDSDDGSGAQEENGNIESQPDEEPLPESGTRYPFRLRGGEYNLFAINSVLDSEIMELKCLKDGKNDNSSENLSPDYESNSLLSYLTDYNRKANELFLCIKPLKEKPDLVRDKDLPDFNPQFDYITGVPRIFYALQTGVDVVPGIDTQVTLDMQPISQEVQIIFTVELLGEIKLNGVPIVELSGICGHFNLMEAYVDTTQLYRSVVMAEQVSQTGNQYVFKARFHTLGVVPSFNPTYLNGPGIVQVAVNAITTEQEVNQNDGRYVYAGVNPYTELTESKIIVEGDDGKLRLRLSQEPIVVNVEKHLIIDGDLLVEPGNGLGWEQHDPDNDINIDI